MLYQMKPVIAVQWNKPGDLPDKEGPEFGEPLVVPTYEGYRCDNNNCGETWEWDRHGILCNVENHEGRCPMVCPGDWIVTDGRGSFVCRRVDFERFYGEVE